MKEKKDKFPSDEECFSLGQERAVLTPKQKLRIKVRLATRKTANPVFVILAVVLVIAGLVVSQIYIKPKKVNGKATANEGLQVSFVGDVMLGRGTEQLAERDSYTSIYSGIKYVWKNSDYVFANLEGALLVGDASKYKKAKKDDSDIYLYESTKAVNQMYKNGINVIAYANNHTGDFRKKSVVNAANWFDSKGIAYSGIYKQPEVVEFDPLNPEQTPAVPEEEIKMYTLLEAGGKKIGFISATDVNPYSMHRYDIMSTSDTELYNYITESKKDGNDLTVVYMHWGTDSSGKITDRQVELAHNLIDSGADIVIGTHPGVLQSAEEYHNGMIFYSLGNFIMDRNDTYSRDSIIVQYNETKDGKGSFTLIPVRINGGRPAVTTNPFYLFRIQKTLTSKLAADSYSIEKNGNIVIPFK